MEKKSKKEARSQETFSKNMEKKSKKEAKARESAAERARKIVKEKESTAKRARKKVAYAMQKAKQQTEIKDKSERAKKGARNKHERMCKESDKKIAHKKELLEKAQVKERVKKLDKLRKKVGASEAFTAAANLKAERASKLVDRQRQRRANQEEEGAQKMIKKKIQVQKMAATSETINKGKLLMP